jgi:predicted nucleic acid-binding protein
MGLYTYSDSNVILNVFSPDKVRAQRARAILEDTARRFVFSDYVWLETLPKMIYNKQYIQVSYTERIFSRAEFVPASTAIIVQAKAIASTYGLAAMDALHVACAIAGGANELVTFEKPVKPFFRIPPEVLRITSLYEAGA